ncbi:formyltransferase family protein [Shewanella algae]|uniref:formyltransferase family protein n=1 Tax=Shewanella algae TaxID=38313 RepID=UPI0031F5BD15
MNELIFAGAGQGGVAALKSLQSSFDSIFVISKDESITSILRPTDKVIEDFTDVDSKVVVCAGYMKIISKEYLACKTFINTHPSLLPKYRGVHSLAWAMLNFEKKLGFTIHLMNENIDDGPILEQFEVEYNNETSRQILQKFENYVENNLGRVVKEYCCGDIIPKVQDKKKATWVVKRNLNDCIIDFKCSIKYIERMFKVLVYPYPLPILKVRGVLYEVLSANFINIDYHTHIGRVVNIENGLIYIKVSDGLLIIEKVREYNCEITLDAADIVKLGERL